MLRAKLGGRYWSKGQVRSFDKAFSFLFGHNRCFLGGAHPHLLAIAKFSADRSLAESSEIYRLQRSNYVAKATG
jgi:hypothetical protein